MVSTSRRLLRCRLIEILGSTPLHLLVRYKPSASDISEFYSILEQMKQAGANINERDANGDTALHISCANDSERNAMWLIRAGSDVTICNKYAHAPNFHRN